MTSNLETNVRRQLDTAADEYIAARRSLEDARRILTEKKGELDAALSRLCLGKAAAEPRRRRSE